VKTSVSLDKRISLSRLLRDREAGYAKNGACVVGPMRELWVYGPGPAKSLLLTVTPTE
jgi:hypothetical protein